MLSCRSPCPPVGVEVATVEPGKALRGLGVLPLEPCLPGKSVRAVTRRMHRIPGLEEYARHHLQDTRLIIHHEDDLGVGENLAVSHVAAPGTSRVSLRRVPRPRYAQRGSGAFALSP